MAAQGYTLFDTPIGRCGIAWNERGIAGVQLPEASNEATQARLAHSFPMLEVALPSTEAQHAIAGIVALLHGAPDDLTDVRLDMAQVPPFHRRVYVIARSIAPGTTCTYGEIAVRLGQPGAARAVGQALGQNPFVIIVPCHRVLAASGGIGGFSAVGGVVTKRRLLRIEGALRSETPDLFGDWG
ncbi:MAG: methylated-DNA--[protein]-cysteine S-methyltransferase [Stenotrophobium sp.]